MIQLKIPQMKEPFLALVDKITDLALAHQVLTDRKLKQPVLVDGGTSYTGVTQIEHYLLELEKELTHWAYCAC